MTRNGHGQSIGDFRAVRPFDGARCSGVCCATNLSFETKVLADLGYDADWIRGFPAKCDRFWANIP